MAKPPYIELGQGPDAERIPILFEDRAVIAIDKPRGWMLVPFTWQKTDRNLQAAIQSSIGSGAFWARSRHVRFLRYVHRLDADTTGVLLFAKSPGGANSLGDLFESRRMHKRYLAVVRGVPRMREWTCELKLEKDPDRIGRMLVDPRNGKDAETVFRVLESRGDLTLVEALPVTGRTHQIRVHLAASGFPVLGDDYYGGAARVPLALRAVELKYEDPFTRRPIRISAPTGWFLEEYGFGPAGRKATPPALSASLSPSASPVPAPASQTALAPGTGASSKRGSSPTPGRTSGPGHAIERARGREPAASMPSKSAHAPQRERPLRPRPTPSHPRKANRAEPTAGRPQPRKGQGGGRNTGGGQGPRSR